MINADPDGFFGYFLDSWVSDPATIDADVREAYLSATRTPEAIHSVCQDYRAGAFIDPRHDVADRAQGTRIAVPTLAIWENPGDTPLPFNPETVWRRWTSDLRTLVLPGGTSSPKKDRTRSPPRSKV